mgnify:CR=1 FL=1
MRTNRGDTLLDSFLDFAAKRPGTLLAAACVFVVGASLFNPSDDSLEARISPSTTTAAPAFESDTLTWSPEYSVTTSAGAIIEIACNGNTTVTVEDGDTLLELASRVDSRQLGPDLPDISALSISKVIAEVNEIEDADVIYAGDKLLLPDQCAAMDVIAG